MRPIISIFLFLFLFSDVFAQQKDLLVQNLNPENVFPEYPEKTFLFNDGNGKTQPSTINFKLDAQQGLVCEVEVLKALSSHYGVQASWVASKAIKKGDVLLARFAMRSIYAKQETGDAEVNFYVQDSQNYEKSIILPLGVNPEWKVFNIPFIAHADMPIGKAAICFSFGALAQKVEIANVEILNFNNRITKNELPETKFTYKGREANAKWRNEALKRIDEIRKAPLKIQVLDAQGKPLEGATVKVKFLKSAFLFGTEVNPSLINQETTDAIKYKEKIKQLFNTVTIGNGLKWGPWIDAERQMETKNAIKWIENNHLYLRGHNLVWPGSKFTPSKFKTKNGFVEGLEDSIVNHIKEIANYTKGKVIAWDVVNEMLHEQDYFKVMPRYEVANWYKLTKQIDPNAQLFLNEYGMLNSISSPNKIQSFIQLIDELKSYGAPIDAIGVQGHVGRQPRDPALVISDLDLLAKTGMPIQITEFDINMPDDELQADYTRDFLIACYSHPALTGFTMWGFWQASHWKPDAAMFKKDWTEKPNAKVWEDLVTKKWSTNFVQKSDKSGLINHLGFLGTYEITISYQNKKEKTVIYELSKSNELAKITL